MTNSMRLQKFECNGGPISKCLFGGRVRGGWGGRGNLDKIQKKSSFSSRGRPLHASSLFIVAIIKIYLIYQPFIFMRWDPHPNVAGMTAE